MLAVVVSASTLSCRGSGYVPGVFLLLLARLFLFRFPLLPFWFLFLLAPKSPASRKRTSLSWQRWMLRASSTECVTPPIFSALHAPWKCLFSMQAMSVGLGRTCVFCAVACVQTRRFRQNGICSWNAKSCPARVRVACGGFVQLSFTDPQNWSANQHTSISLWLCVGISAGVPTLTAIFLDCG